MLALQGDEDYDVEPRAQLRLALTKSEKSPPVPEGI